MTAGTKCSRSNIYPGHCPSPGSVGIGEMPHVFGRPVPVVAAGAGVGVESGAVPGNRKVFPRYEAAIHGRKDSRMIEEALQAFLKVKRDIFPVHEPFYDGFCDFGLCFLGFLFSAFGFIRLFAVPGSRKQFIACV